ncbi:MAG: glycoside hydrolase family 13 protein [Clostridia bacterium]|nr:glycoside hydrolase family 13 protein [Clostridia bacterium]
MFYIPYNSRKDYHKSPFGAAPVGEPVTFRVILPREFGCRSVQLAVHEDAGPTETVPAEWERMEGDGEEWWRVVWTPPAVGLYWYRFFYETDFGSMEIRLTENGVGRISRSGGEWQLTVYDPQTRAPAWVPGGILYQIFPDRFRASGQPKKNVPASRVLRADWGGEPMWETDGAGRIRKYDFFGGDLAGVREKLPYLRSLGVSCIYLNPIFEAASNHRYDTADYETIDPLLGTEADFKALCDAAHEHGIRVLLDGVFSHTGDDSRYFNKYGHYKDTGAYQSRQSPYYPWYTFRRWPRSYDCWWGIDILPEVREENESYRAYITDVARKWLSLGADGWRLDVADELPDAFLDEFYAAVKAEKPDAYVLGEVWEDASIKISYGHRRRYLLGGQMDSVMNYPFAEAILRFLQTGSAERFMDAVLTVLENYPPQSIRTLMNHIGTHDTARALTRLVGSGYSRSAWKAGGGRLTPDERKKGTALLRAAAMLQYTLPGVPCVYYGDEAGMEGGEDPFNRECYPWGREDAQLVDYYRSLGAVRRTAACFTDGDFVPVSAALGCVAFARVRGDSRALTIVNRNDHPIDYYLPAQWQSLRLALGGSRPNGGAVRLDACGAALLVDGE